LQSETRAEEATDGGNVALNWQYETKKRRAEEATDGGNVALNWQYETKKRV